MSKPLQLIWLIAKWATATKPISRVEEWMLTGCYHFIIMGYTNALLLEHLEGPLVDFKAASTLLSPASSWTKSASTWPVTDRQRLNRCNHSPSIPIVSGWCTCRNPSRSCGWTDRHSIAQATLYYKNMNQKPNTAQKVAALKKAYAKSVQGDNKNTHSNFWGASRHIHLNHYT